MAPPSSDVGTSVAQGDLSHAFWETAMPFGTFLPKEYETIASLPGLVPGFGMAPEGYLSYSAGPNIRPRRTQPWAVRERIDPIPPKGLQLL